MTKKEPLHVLYIEDDPADIELAQEALAHTCVDVEYRIIVTVDEAEVMAECGRRPPDIILMDFQLPGTDGIELLRRLRKSTWLENVPVIFISSVVPSTFKHKAEALAVSAFFDKPLDFGSFKKVFREICHEWFKPLSEAKA